MQKKFWEILSSSLRKKKNCWGKYSASHRKKSKTKEIRRDFCSTLFQKIDVFDLEKTRYFN